MGDGQGRGLVWGMCSAAALPIADSENVMALVSGGRETIAPGHGLIRWALLSLSNLSGDQRCEQCQTTREPAMVGLILLSREGSVTYSASPDGLTRFHGTAPS